MKENELHWLIRAQDGDDQAFNELVSLYQNPVYNLCFRMLGNQGDAEDAAQETFWRAYQSIKKCDPDKKFATWLLSIAAHHCIDLQRKRRLPQVEIEDWMEETIPESTPTPESAFVTKLEQERIQKLLQKLPSQDRAVLIFKYWYQMSELEIAESLKITTSAVKSRLHRTRLKLAELYRQDSTVMERMKHESPAV
ncbi:MAG TPA: sigma-70 family RNA polymerase sigma factor [Bellilinea sp.]|nr:sigma-70 family RNA polymerase sigma factor [Bellilinea sp.]